MVVRFPLFCFVVMRDSSNRDASDHVLDVFGKPVCEPGSMFGPAVQRGS